MNKHLTTDIIICTKNRPADLAKALNSIAAQTVVPKNTIIADASDDTKTKNLVEHLSKTNPGFKITYLKCPVPGSTFQRNYGIKHSKNEIVFFFDDDVILESDYIENTLKVYNEHPDIGGVSGNMLNQPTYSLPYKLFKFLFFLPYTSPKVSNKLRFSGFPKVSTGQNKITSGNFMEGGLCSYKRNILDTYYFDEKLTKYAFLEDIDLSYRVSKKYILMRTPYSRLNHYPSPSSRINRKELRAVYTLNHFYLFVKNMPKNPITVFAHFWSHIGLLIEGIIAAIINKNFSYITGMFSGYNKIIKYTFSGFKNLNNQP